MVDPNVTTKYVNEWFVLFNAPNTLCWLRIILLFVSIRYFGKRNYLLFVVYHTVSGFLDSFDGILARSLDQKSLLGKFFETILDSYAHFVMYTCIGLIYPSYIVYFYIEIALELWNMMFDLNINMFPDDDRSWLHRETFLSSRCAPFIYRSSSLRLFNWYGPDIFHTVLIIRSILLSDNSKKLTRYIQRYILLDKVFLLIKLTIIFTGFFTVLRTAVTSCVLFEKLYKLAGAPKIH